MPRPETARTLHLSRNTVAKHADMEDMSPAVPRPAERARPALEGHEGWIGGVLAADLGAPRKQRHTARRIYDRRCVALMSQRSECLRPGSSRYSGDGAARPRRWCSTTPPRRAGWCAARSLSRGCSRSSGPTTASRADTATLTRATRRARSRTRRASCGGTFSCLCRRSTRSPSSTRSSPMAARGSMRCRAVATGGRTERRTARTSPRCGRFPARSSTR